MEVINIQDVWGRWRLSLFRALPRYEPFLELSGRPRTEIALKGNSYSLFRNSLANRPLAKQAMAYEGVSPTEACKVLRKGEEVVVSVGLEHCFVRQVKLPQPALGKIGAVLDLDVARLTPFAPGSVFAGWINRGSSGNDSNLNIDHVIIRKDIITDIVGALRNCRADPIGILVRDGNGPALPLALAIDGASFRLSLVKLWMKLSAAGFSALLLCAAIFAAVILARQQQSIEAIEMKSTVIEKDVVEVQSRLDQIKAKSSEIRNLQARKSEIATRLEIIEELSRVLPDDAFLGGVSIELNQIIVDGSALSPESLISAFESSPIFQEVSFISPVFRNPGEEKSHFSIKLKTETPAGEIIK